MRYLNLFIRNNGWICIERAFSEFLGLLNYFNFILNSDRTYQAALLTLKFNIILKLIKYKVHNQVKCIKILNIAISCPTSLTNLWMDFSKDCANRTQSHFQTLEEAFFSCFSIFIDYKTEHAKARYDIMTQRWEIIMIFCFFQNHTAVMIIIMLIYFLYE